MHHTGRNGEYSCVENFHGDDLYKHNINKHSCTHQSLPEHQVSKIYEYLTKRHIKSYQHMEGPNAFTNYVKTTLNHGASIMEVDWGGNTDPNDTSSRCMLKEVDWGAHETHQNEHSTTKVHWGGDDPGINPMDGYSISEVDVYIDPDAKPKNFFTKEMGLNYVEGKLVHHLALKKGMNQLDHQWDQQWDHTRCGPPTTFNRPRSVSKSMPEFDHYILVGSEENGERFKFHLSQAHS